MSKALVLGCGNTLRGDDGVALHVVDYLRKALSDPSIEFLFQRQWTPELVEPISQSELVVFVDAALGTMPGSIECRQLQASLSKSPAYTHLTSVESLLVAADELYGRHPEHAYLMTITGGSFEFEEVLSDPVRRAIPRAAEQIKKLLLGICATRQTVGGHEPGLGVGSD